MSRLASEYALEHMNLTKSLKAEKNRRALGRLRQIFDAVEADRDRMFRASVKLHAQFGRDIREAREDAKYGPEMNILYFSPAHSVTLDGQIMSFKIKENGALYVRP